jgi:phage tail P2-like protein
MSDLLPLNATKQERALSLSTARAGSFPVPVGDLWNPYTCPVGILPWLAWSLAVDPWDSTWTEGQKRQAIADSIAVHRVKGTIGALKRALQAIGYECVVNDQTGVPYVFRVGIDVTSGAAVETAYAQAESIALKVKNARSHLLSIDSLIKHNAMSVLAAECDGVLIEVKPA